MQHALCGKRARPSLLNVYPPYSQEVMQYGAVRHQLNVSVQVTKSSRYYVDFALFYLFADQIRLHAISPKVILLKSSMHRCLTQTKCFDQIVHQVEVVTSDRMGGREGGKGGRGRG